MKKSTFRVFAVLAMLVVTLAITLLPTYAAAYSTYTYSIDGTSGFEIMQGTPLMPPMSAADNRRIPGWRILREYLSPRIGQPVLRISSECETLIRSLPALLCDAIHPEDASSEPHDITHAPEALRYAVMSRAQPYREQSKNNHFRFKAKSTLF